MGTAASGHRPVMTDRVLALLGPALGPPGSVLLDATLGRAGHAGALLAEHPGLALIGVDTDGYFRMTVLSADRIEMCYAHNGLSPTGSMVATCYVMERAKK